MAESRDDVAAKLANAALTLLTVVIVVLAVVTIIVQLLPVIPAQIVSVLVRPIVSNIPFAGMHIAHWIYLCLAVIFSLVYGFGAFRIHGGTPPKGRWGQRWQQYMFNAAGAAVGWLAGWVVLLRWLSCPGYVCPGEPTGWTILLAVLAFVGITGYLPLTLMQTIAALKALLAKLSP